jgi:hypothetical protein
MSLIYWNLRDKTEKVLETTVNSKSKESGKALVVRDQIIKLQLIGK